MKRNFNAIILNLEGQPFDGSPTLKTIAFMAISAQALGDDRMTGDEKLKLYAVGTKVAAGGVVDLKAEEIAVLKDRIGKTMFPVIVGRAFDLLDADFTEDADQAKDA